MSIPIDNDPPRNYVRPIETCLACGGEIRIQIQRGSGYCCQNCQRQMALFDVTEQLQKGTHERPL